MKQIVWMFLLIVMARPAFAQEAAQMPNRCANNPAITGLGANPEWNGWGSDTSNSRFQNQQIQPSQLKLKCDTLAEFMNTIKTGTDPDQLHPNTCSAAITTNCVPFPFNPAKLQVMRWPSFQDMTDRDLSAIYEYLSAIPCIGGPPAPNPRHHDC
jgi:hypothetical protein